MNFSTPLFFQLTVSCLVEIAHSTTENIVDGSLLDAEELNITAAVVIEELKEGTARVDGDRIWSANSEGKGKMDQAVEKQ